MLSIRAVYFDLPIVNTPVPSRDCNRENCAGKWQSKLIQEARACCQLGLRLKNCRLLHGGNGGTSPISGLAPLSPNRRRLVVIGMTGACGWPKDTAMNGRELTVLRTKLRWLNIEYSALVRAKRREGTLVRMEALRVERRAVMSRIAEQRQEESVRSAGALSLPGSEMDVAYAAGATVGPGASSIEVPLGPASSGDRFSA